MPENVNLTAVTKFLTYFSLGSELRHCMITVSISMRSEASAFITIVLLLLRLLSMASSDPTHHSVLQCLFDHSDPTIPTPIASIVLFPTSPSYSSVLQSSIRNLRFNSSSTPKPSFIVTPTHVSHIQASIICCTKYGLQMRIRSGGHDYDGLSYTSSSSSYSHVNFMILDMLNFRSIQVDLDDETVWVDSGSTIAELNYKIAEKSRIHGFPAGVCPTVGIGGHFSGGGYGNMMRKFGLTVDNVLDAKLVDANGRILDRESMGEDLFWAIRGEGGGSFGVIFSWKIKLVRVPEIVTVFRVQKTLEQNASEIVHQWQLVTDKMDKDLFIRVVIMPVNKGHRTIRAKFNALFIGNAHKLLHVMSDTLPELGLKKEDCIEMSWIESVLFWANYPVGTSLDVLLDRHPTSEKFLKRKSDYVRNPISKTDLEGIWKKMMELGKPVLNLNAYGGRMGEIPEEETPFPHRAGNIYKIQYSVNWKDEGDDAANTYLDLIQRLYDYMTPYVSKSPRGSYLNYRDVDIGTNGPDHNASYEVASVWGTKYFKGNFDRLVEIKSMVDPNNFFRYEQSIPSLPSWRRASWQSNRWYI